MVSQFSIANAGRNLPVFAKSHVETFVLSGVHERDGFSGGGKVSQGAGHVGLQVPRTDGPGTPEAAALAEFINRPQAVAQIGGGANPEKQKTRSAFGQDGFQFPPL